jgi:pYEATS domain-containing protein involved in immunity
MMSRNNVVFAAIGTITITVVGALLSTVFSPVFAPLSEDIKEMISREPNTTEVTAMTFDNDNRDISKHVNYGDTIASNSITFNFTAVQPPFLGIRYSPNFQCSFDGAPFADCVPPISYGNLPTEVGHSFQVRAKGILGNLEKSPYKFYFTAITSASVEGVIKRNGTMEVADANITLDSKFARITEWLAHANGLETTTLDSNFNPRTATTDSKGRFQFEGLGQGNQYFVVNYTLDKKPELRKDYFFIPAGEQSKEFDFEFQDMSPVAIPSAGKISDPNATNPEYKRTKDPTKPQIYTIDLAQESKLMQQEPDVLSTKIWLNTSDDVLSKIENVTYYLHPTFNPNVITSYTKENKFLVTFTNWGIFNLKAKVHFENGTVNDLELPTNKWTVSLPPKQQ